MKPPHFHFPILPGVLLPLLLLSFPSCTSTPMPVDENTEAVVVTIGLFSGRPNPRMTLSDEQASELAGLVRSTLGAEPSHPPGPPKLGAFHGFRIEVPDSLAAELGLPLRATVREGVVTDMTDRKPVHWHDGAGVERFLTRLAYEEGFGDLLERVDVPRPE